MAVCENCGMENEGSMGICESCGEQLTAEGISLTGLVLFIVFAFFAVWSAIAGVNVLREGKAFGVIFLIPLVIAVVIGYLVFRTLSGVEAKPEG